MSFKDYLDCKEVRLAIIKKFTGKYTGNWQDVITPEVIVKGMVDLVKDEPELLYVVLFNLEFVEELVFEREIDRERVMIMADSPEEAAIAMGVYGVKTLELPHTVRDPKEAIKLVEAAACKAFYNGGPMPKSNNLVVLGNPPYQKLDGGHSKSATPIYHLFVQAALEYTNPRYLSFIIPSRWMAGGKGLDKFRARMMPDKHLRVIRHFPGSREVFKDVNIEFGVNYFLWDRDYKGKCDFNGKHRHLDEYDIILSDNEAVSILDKVLAVHGGLTYLDKRVCPTKPFGLRTFFKDWKATGIKCYAQGRQEKLVDPGCFTDTSGILGKWKVVTSEGRGEGNTQRDADGKTRVISTIFQIEPGAICTETYVPMGAFDVKGEADNFQTYVQTKFFRFMLSLRLTGQHVNMEKFSWVPDLGSYASAPTDGHLFRKFGLTEDEINYINKRIK